MSTSSDKDNNGKSGDNASKENQGESSSEKVQPNGDNSQKSSSSNVTKNVENLGTPEPEPCSGDNVEEEEDDEDDDDDTTISSEAVVDDIELILMPEETEDLTGGDMSPQLVRVTELNRVGRLDDQEEEDKEGDSCRRFESICVGDDDYILDEEDGALSGAEDDLTERDEEDEEGRRTVLFGEEGDRVHSEVQTDITALDDVSFVSEGYKSKGNKKSKGGKTGRRLNWKSEMTLLPSKTTVKQATLERNKSDIDYEDDTNQYSARVAKFTSQDTLSPTSRFLRPSSLYRTRNLSRNLNNLGSTESTLILPMADGNDAQMSASNSTTNFKGISKQSCSFYQISNVAKTRPQHYYSSGSMAKGFRSSLPDLSLLNKSSFDNNAISSGYRKRQAQRSNVIKQHHHHYSSGIGGSSMKSGGGILRRKSSSEDDTSSLIDESERCLRSSIDLLLTDESNSGNPHMSSSQYTFHSHGITRSYGYTASGSLGMYSSRRTFSQPLLTGSFGDCQDATMGSPFLPRKLSDMRCSRWAKVILPNGNVSVVNVKETDEYRDVLTVSTDGGNVLTIPFRKVVFAWKLQNH